MGTGPDARRLNDFRREGDDSNFYPRGKKPRRYAYRAPPARDDGWATGTLEQARIDRTAIEKFVQTLIEMPIESVHTLEVHGVLIARMDPIGCDEAPTELAQDQSISLGFRSHLMVTARTVRGAPPLAS